MTESTTIRTLKGKKLFSDVFQSGKKISTDLINGIYVFNKNCSFNDFRFAVAVSKKISKKAVIRNRYKRLLRESLRQIVNEKSQNISPLEFIILIWRKPVKSRFDFSLIEVKKNVRKIFEDIQIKSERLK